MFIRNHTIVDEWLERLQMFWCERSMVRISLDVLSSSASIVNFSEMQKLVHWKEGRMSRRSKE